MNQKKPTIPRLSLAIYRIKDSFTEDIFRSDTDLTDGAETWRSESDFTELATSVIVRTPMATEPSWKSFVSTIAPELEKQISSRTAQSAAVAFALGSSRYAVTFGHGRMLLVPEAIERRFGLRCALDLISTESMLSVGYKQVDHTTLFSNVQANRRVDFASFQVDTEASILNGVVGRPARDQPMYSKVLGGDALHLNPRILGDEAGLLDFVGWVNDVHGRKGYKQKGYEWIDQISLVTDAGKIRELEKALGTELMDLSNAATKSQLWFAPPGTVEYGDIESLSIQGTRGKTVGEVTIAAIREARGSRLSVADLQGAYIRGHNASGVKVKDWRAFDWLNWETSSGNESVILQAGDFYLIEKSYEKRIDRHLKTLDDVPPGYPDWMDRKADEDEEIYNKLLAGVLKKARCLDRKNFTKSFRGHGALELCDVLIKGETANDPTALVFVKKYSESSPALSHLFAQGPNSIETVLRDEHFREEIRTELSGLKKVFPERSPKPSSLAMTFVILTKDERRKVTTLPFFSKLSLYRASKWAESHGIPVSVGTRAMAVHPSEKRPRGRG